MVVIDAYFAYTDSDKYDAAERPLFGDDFFGSLGMLTYLYGVTTTMPTLRGDMQKPGKLGKIIWVVHGMAAVVYIAITSMSILAYGDMVQSPVSLSFGKNLSLQANLERSHFYFAFCLLFYFLFCDV